ncbi:MAG: sugar-binding protein [Victivallales bacterium]
MKKLLLLAVVLSLAVDFALSAENAQPVVKIFDIPYVDGIIVDGKGDDWGTRGFRDEWLNVYMNGFRPKLTDFDTTLRLGWNEKGLLVILVAKDDIVYEATEDMPYEMDNIEVYMAGSPGSADMNDIFITVDPYAPKGKQLLDIQRRMKKNIEISVERTKSDKGFVYEMLIPWKNLDKIPKEGDTVAFQIEVNEVDGGNDKAKFLFYGYESAAGNHENMATLRLVKTSSENMVSMNRLVYGLKGNYFQVYAKPEYEGKMFSIRNSTRSFGKWKLNRKQDVTYCYGRVLLPPPKAGEFLCDMEVVFEDGQKTRGAFSIVKPINLFTSLKKLEVSGNSAIISLDITDDEKNADYYFSSPLNAKGFLFDDLGKEVSRFIGRAGKDIQFNIPREGRITLLVLLTDIENDVLAGRVLTFQDGKQVDAMKGDSPSTTMAFPGIGPFVDAVVDIASIRDRVSAVLVHNYNSITLSRSHGFSLATENAINKMNQVAGAKAGAPGSTKIPSADYALTGYYRKYGLSWNVDKDYICDIIVNDIRSAGEKFKKMSIASNPLNTWKIAAPVISALNLPQREPKYHNAKKLDESWAVLPLVKIASPEDVATANRDTASSLRMEIALQESGRIARIVSHDDIDKILSEIKVDSFREANDRLAGDVAKIVGADRIIMGTISSSGNFKHQIDLFLVDGKNAVVLDSASALCLKMDINDTAAILALKFCDRKYVPPSLPDQPDELRKKEADIYLKVARETAFSSNANAMLYLEAAYYLIGDENNGAYRIGSSIIFNVLTPENSMKKEQKLELIGLIDKILGQVKPTKEASSPIAYRAAARIFSGLECDSAEKLINEQESKFPGLCGEYSDYLRVELYKRQGKFKEAASIAEKIPTESDKRWTFTCIDIYKELGDEKKELEAREHVNSKDGLQGSDAVRLVILTAKLKGHEEAIKTADTVDRWARKNPLLLLEVAKSHIALGDKKNAAISLSKINNDEIDRSLPPAEKSKFLDEVKKVSLQVGDVKIEWKSAAAVKKFPEKYKIYIQPVGKQDLKYIEEAIPEVAKFYGAKVELLPVIPLPEDNPYAFNKQRGQYSYQRLVEAIALSAPVPKDSIYVCNVIKEDMYYSDMKFITHCYDKNYGAVLSYNGWLGTAKSVIGPLIVKGIVSSFGDHYKSCTNLPEDITEREYGKVCTNPSCVFSSSSSRFGDTAVNIAMCEECQQIYAKVDFDSAWNVFQNIRKPSKCPCDNCVITKKRKAYIDKYRNEIQEALSKVPKPNDKI